ncbi:MAG: C-terminal helicase domain-containing protein, partial [Alphaproteobacteria bacterium]|nr:C-terminal helicase domain-containing protein [Alphaproteobacteria bacterium]
KTADRIDQTVIHMENGAKPTAIFKLVQQHPGKRVIVFCRTKRGSDKVAKKLGAEGIGADAIHGNKSQGQRQRALDAFRKGDRPVLIATDIAARGIDIREVEVVVNYDLPNVPEAYVHRIGRTGRAGKSGESYLFETPKDHKLMQAVITAIGHPIDAVDLSGFSAPDYLAPASKKKMPAKGQGAKVTESQKPSVDDLPRKDESQPRKEALEDRRERRHNWNRIETETLPEVGFGETIPAFMKVIPASTGPDAKKSPEKSKKKK